MSIYPKKKNQGERIKRVQIRKEEEKREKKHRREILEFPGRNPKLLKCPDCASKSYEILKVDSGLLKGPMFQIS